MDFEVGIIGGGPSGASMASYLAKAGVSCVVFEKELFPRPHVGESLVPSSTRVFKDLDFLPVMEEARFPRKYGAAWTAAKSAKVYTTNWQDLAADPSVDVLFGERHQPGVDQNYTYHVDRGLFDNLLLQHAHRLGAQVYQGVNVCGVDVSEDCATIRYAMGARQAGTQVRIVVDASGRRTLMGTQRRWRRADPVFRQFALHAWFDGFDRNAVAVDHSQADFIFIHFLPVTNTWMWQIPITDRITSVGVVTQKQHFSASRASREKFFWDCVGSRPELCEQLRAATQLRPLKEEGNYSYEMTQLTADRLLLVGDAARFVDPIFSTGVSIALNSSRFASRDILAALGSGDFSRKSFSMFETTLRRGTRNWYRFISVYYRLNVLFTAFVNNPKYRLDVLKLLQGDVYDEEEPAVLAQMRDTVRAVEGNPDHVWHGALGDLTAKPFELASLPARTSLASVSSDS